MKTSVKLSGIVAALMLAVSGAAMSAEQVSPYVHSSDGKIVKSGYGLCYRTGFWTPALAQASGDGCNCDADILGEACVEPAPVVQKAPEKVTLSADTLFAYNKADLKAEGEAALDELVSKIAGVDVEVIVTTGYADRIGLFEDTKVDGVQYNASTTNSTSFVLGADADVSAAAVPHFYVNSSALRDEGYKVTLTTDEMGGTTYQATTKLSELPRNSVFPLILQLDDFALDFTARCWLSPIGAGPTPVIVTLESEDTYSLKLPEGSQFELTLNGVNTDNMNATNVSCTWDFDENTVNGLAFEGYQPGSTVVKGHVTASAGREFPLTCEAQWTLNDTQYHRTYTVNVITDDIFNFDFDTSSNAAQNRFGLLWLNTEMLNMSRH